MRIGVFDSGVGGLTVLAELRHRFPEADYIYLGDTANVPYGTKSSAQIERLSRDCAARMREFGIDSLVVACNTASSLALPAIREELGAVPVIGMVQPGAESVIAALTSLGAPASAILVLATSATVRSQAYGRALRELLVAGAPAPGASPLPILEQACPLLVPMIEEGWVDHPVLHLALREYLGGHFAAHGPGVALLGCTHYPWIQPAIEKALPGWTVINSAQAVADALERSGLAGPSAPRRSATPSRVEWVFTDPLAVPAFARSWMEGVRE